MIQQPEVQLAYLGFQRIPPRSLLQPYVRSYWSFKSAAPLSGYREEFMHPTGGYGIVFNLGDSLRLDAQPITPPVFLDGANTVSRKMGFSGHVDLIGIRFYEGGAFPFLGIPLIELRDGLDVLSALDDGMLLSLHSRLYETQSLSARIAILEGWLIERLTLGIERSALIPESLARLRRQIATLGDGERFSPIATLANDLAISQRQLENLYRSQIGLTPLHYLRLQRVEAARLALKGKPQSNTRLAADLGYYDQAHFIREFSAVVGITPFAYMKRKHREDTPG